MLHGKTKKKQRVGQLCAWAVGGGRDRWSDGALARGWVGGREKSHRTPTRGRKQLAVVVPSDGIQGVRPAGQWFGGRPGPGNG